MRTFRKLSRLAFLRKQGGNAMLAAMGASVLVASAAAMAYKNFNVTQDTLRNARIKNAMAVVEAQVRRRALQPEAYRDCSSVTGTNQCQINSDFFSDLMLRKVTGAQCSPAPAGTCGVQLLNLSLDRAEKKFFARISYTGKEARINSIDVELEIPVEVLQADQIHCGMIDPRRPIFVGFDASGAPICKGFNVCSASQYVKGVDLASPTRLVCADLPPPTNCGSQQMLDDLDWDGSNSLHAHCRNLFPPPFVSNLTTRAAAFNPGPDRTPPIIDTAVVTNTITHTVSTTITQTATATEPACTPDGWGAGYYRIPVGTIYYFNGADAYCGFASPEHMSRFAGGSMPVATDVPHAPKCMRYDGACPDPGSSPPGLMWQIVNYSPPSGATVIACPDGCRDIACGGRACSTPGIYCAAPPTYGNLNPSYYMWFICHQ